MCGILMQKYYAHKQLYYVSNNSTIQEYMWIAEFKIFEELITPDRLIPPLQWRHN